MNPYSFLLKTSELFAGMVNSEPEKEDGLAIVFHELVIILVTKLEA